VRKFRFKFKKLFNYLLPTTYYLLFKFKNRVVTDFEKINYPTISPPYSSAMPWDNPRVIALLSKISFTLTHTLTLNQFG
jgi:hypothetical protein